MTLGDYLEETEAIGICGSLAREGRLSSERSDIDIFVVLKKKGPDADRIWWNRINTTLRNFGRDITVLVYTVKGLRRISNWYVLRLATEGILVFDKGDIAELFNRIVEAAKQAGLVQRRVGDSWVWSAPELKLGEVLEFQVE